MQARAHFPDGSRLRVSLSRSNPSEIQSSRVDVRVYGEKQDMDGKVTLTQIHEHPGRLRANEALQKISDHREGKVIKQALGVDPKMLNPQPSREAQKAPDKAREQRQGVEI